MPRNALEPFGTRRNGNERVGMVWNASECRRTRSKPFERAAIHSDGLKSIRMDCKQIGCAPNHSDEPEMISGAFRTIPGRSEASGCIRIDLDCVAGKKTGRKPRTAPAALPGWPFQPWRASRTDRCLARVRLPESASARHLAYRGPVNRGLPVREAGHLEHEEAKIARHRRDGGIVHETDPLLLLLADDLDRVRFLQD